MIDFNFIYYLYKFVWETIIAVKDMIQINYFTLSSDCLCLAFVEQSGVSFIMGAFFVCAVKEQFVITEPFVACIKLIVKH